MTKPDTEFPDTRASLLLQLKASDDNEAWLQFVTIYRPIIYRLARKRGLQDADAQDLAQQVLISVAGAIGRWEKRDESIRFRHWLRRVVRNAICHSLIRGPKDRAVGGTSIQAMLEVNPAADDDVAREIELEHRREILLRAASIVKTDVAAGTWQVFELAVIQGLRIDEVAARVNKTVGAAYAARGRVIHRLRQAVDQLEQLES